MTYDAGGSLPSGLTVVVNGPEPERVSAHLDGYVEPCAACATGACAHCEFTVIDHARDAIEGCPCRLAGHVEPGRAALRAA